MPDILSWIKLPKNLAWPLVIVCALLLWGPEDFKTGLGVQPFIDSYRQWFGVVFLFFLIVGLQPIAPFVYEITINRYKESKQKKEAEERAKEIERIKEENIKNLTDSEKDILIYFLKNKTRTQDLNFQNGDVDKLTQLGFIYRASDVSYGGRRGSFTFPYSISDWAWAYIQKNPEVLT